VFFGAITQFCLKSDLPHKMATLQDLKPKEDVPDIEKASENQISLPANGTGDKEFLNSSSLEYVASAYRNVRTRCCLAIVNEILPDFWWLD
jgi:hypothetical protein